MIGNFILGSLPFLAPHGRHPFCQALRIDPKVRHYHWRPSFRHLGSGTRTGRSESVPNIAGQTVAMFSEHQTKWQHNCISFRRGHNKVLVPTQEMAAQSKGITPLYAEDINMLKGVDDIEVEAYLDDHSRIVPLFEIDIIETVADYAPTTMLQEEAYELEP